MIVIIFIGDFDQKGKIYPFMAISGASWGNCIRMFYMAFMKKTINNGPLEGQKNIIYLFINNLHNKKSHLR